MQENVIKEKSQDLTMLTNEVIYHRYLLNNGKMRKFFKELSMPEYIALHNIVKAGRGLDGSLGRTYLKDLAENLQIPIRRVSNMVGKLKDQGLLVWSHDGDGSDGTYVTITELGQKLLAEQERSLKTYYGKVIQKLGEDNLMQLLQLMQQLETVMGNELQEMEVGNANGDGTEE